MFLDTSGWLSVLSSRETHHAAARTAYRTALTEGRAFVTSNLVVAEMHVLIVRRRGPKAGLRFLDALRDDPTHQVVHADADLEEAAIERWLRRFDDDPVSLADAVSFAIMDDEGIDSALALDRHFRLAGFAVVP